MNVKLLRKIQKHILEEPKRFKMSGWVTEKSDGISKAFDSGVNYRGEWNFAKCGTAACIGGWAIILSGKLDDVKTNHRDYSTTAGNLLEIDRSSRNRLFGVCSWPSEFADRFVNGRSLRARAEAAAERIDHFIKTKGAE